MDDIKNFLADIKDTRIYDDRQVDFASEALEKAYDSADRSKKRNQELGQEALEILGQHFHSLASMSDSDVAQNKEQLIPKDERFWQLFDQFERPTFKSSRVEPNNLPGDSASAPFFFMDIVQPTTDGNAIALTTSFPGFPHALCRPIIWAEILKPFVEWVLNVKHRGRFGTSAARVLHGLFGAKLGRLKDQTVHCLNLSAKKYGNMYWNWLKSKFWPFLDSTEFYVESDPIYGEPMDKEDMVFVFSTTSGLLIPEEHFGRRLPRRLAWLRETTAAKNPARLGYFARGILSSQRKIPVSYAWDAQRTRQTLRANYQKAPDKKSKEIYRKESERILTKAMRSNGLEIVQMQFERVGDWYLDPRAYLTLTSKRYAIWSWRPPQKGDVHVGHGLKIDGESFGKILKLQSTTAGIASLSANNVLLGTILAMLPLVPENGVSDPLARMTRTLQHRVVRRLYDCGSNREVIKDPRPIRRKEATTKAADIVDNYLASL